MDGREDTPSPRSARDYLEDWTNPEKGWLRKFYPSGNDIPHYGLTPNSEKVIQWSRFSWKAPEQLTRYVPILIP